jgi:hypothetical protein
MYKKQTMGITLLLGLLHPGAIQSVRANVPAIPLAARQELSAEQITALGKEFFELVDLQTPGLEKARGLVAESDFSAALNAYRDALLDDLKNRDFGEMVTHWGVSSADEMLQGIVRLKRHAGGISKNNIGLPGAIDWVKPTVDEILDEPKNVEPAARESSNRDWSTHLASMHHMLCLVDAYAVGCDVKYAALWLATWEDFALRQKDAVRHADEKQFNSLGAGWGVLFVAWRMEGFWKGLNRLAKQLPADQYGALPGPELARVLISMANDHAAVQAVRLKDAKGAPNQIAHAASCLMIEALGFKGGKQTADWARITRDFVARYYRSINLPDGTNFEQAVNYNKGNPELAVSLLRMYGPGTPDWLEPFLPCARQTLLYLASVVRNGSHHGALTRMGQDDRMEDGRLRRYLKYLPNEDVERILNHVYGDGKLPPPSFSSVAFPYSGYYVMRTGWGKDDAYSFFKASRRPRGHARSDNAAIHFICAYGRDLLIDSGSSSYGEHKINAYLQSSFSKNTIQVDCKGQVWQDNRGPETSADKPIANRWLTSSRYDFAEGVYAGGYEDPKIMVRHERQLIFLRDPQIWIVTDRLRGETGTMSGTETHTYTQTWNFPEDFAPDQVTFDVSKKIIQTLDPKGPNISLRHFSSAQIEYEKYYGQENPMRGWIRVSGLDNLKAVDMHANWKGSGDQVLVTLIIPSRRMENRVAKVESFGSGQDTSICGFSLALKDGTRITYQAALNSAVLHAGSLEARASALLLTELPEGSSSGIMLDARAAQADCEFELAGGNFKEVKAISCPEDKR